MQGIRGQHTVHHPSGGWGIQAEMNGFRPSFRMAGGVRQGMCVGHELSETPTHAEKMSKIGGLDEYSHTTKKPASHLVPALSTFEPKGPIDSLSRYSLARRVSSLSRTDRKSG